MTADADRVLVCAVPVLLLCRDGFIDLQEFQALVKIEVSRWKRYQKTSSFCAIA